MGLAYIVFSSLLQKYVLEKSKLTWAIGKLNSSEESGRRGNYPKLFLGKKSCCKTAIANNWREDPSYQEITNNISENLRPGACFSEVPETFFLK